MGSTVNVNSINIHYLNNYLVKEQISNTFDVINYALTKSHNTYPIPLKDDLVNVLKGLNTTSKSIALFNSNFSLSFKYFSEYRIPTIHQIWLNEHLLTLKDLTFDMNFFNNTYYNVDSFRDPRNNTRLGFQYIEDELEQIFYKFTKFDEEI